MVGDSQIGVASSFFLRHLGDNRGDRLGGLLFYADGSFRPFFRFIEFVHVLDELQKQRDLALDPYTPVNISEMGLDGSVPNLQSLAYLVVVEAAAHKYRHLKLARRHVVALPQVQPLLLIEQHARRTLEQCFIFFPFFIW